MLFIPISLASAYVDPPSLHDALPILPIGDGKVWHVTNAEGSGYASMTLESATVNSVNTVYAQLIEQLGPQKVVERSEEHTSELQSPCNLVCRLLLEKKNIKSLTIRRR